MEATRRSVPQLQPAPGVHGLTRQAFASNFLGQPGAAWIGNTDFVTVKNA